MTQIEKHLCLKHPGRGKPEHFFKAKRVEGRWTWRCAHCDKAAGKSGSGHRPIGKFSMSIPEEFCEELGHHWIEVEDSLVYPPARYCRRCKRDDPDEVLLEEEES